MAAAFTGAFHRPPAIDTCAPKSIARLTVYAFNATLNVAQEKEEVKMRTIWLIAVLFVSACATAFPPKNATTTTYHPVVERVMGHLHRALPEQDQLHFQYRVWSSPTTTKPELRVEDDTIYINEGQLTLNDDALAFGLGHEIYHLLQHHGLGDMVTLGRIGLSAGTGAAVGYYTTWWVGTAVGCGLWGCLFPPIILAASRSGEGGADEFAIQLMVGAGFDADRALNTWCGLWVIDDQALTLAGQDPEGWSRTHPSGQKRCTVLRDLAATLGTN